MKHCNGGPAVAEVVGCFRIRLAGGEQEGGGHCRGFGVVGGALAWNSGNT